MPLPLYPRHEKVRSIPHTSAFGLLVSSALGGHNKVSISFRPQGVDSGHEMDFGTQPLTPQMRNSSNNAANRQIQAGVEFRGR